MTTTLAGLFRRIKKGMAITKPTPFEVLSALDEEVGEYALAVRVEMGLKKRELDEPARVEAIDIFLIAMEAYIANGGTEDHLFGIIDEKLGKWESSFEGQTPSL